MKILGNDDVSGIVAVELGDSATRSIKVMEVVYDEATDKVAWSTNGAPKVLYQSKALHGTDQYREIGIPGVADPEFEDDGKNTP